MQPLLSTEWDWIYVGDAKGSHYNFVVVKPVLRVKFVHSFFLAKKQICCNLVPPLNTLKWCFLTALLLNWFCYHWCLNDLFVLNRLRKLEKTSLDFNIRKYGPLPNMQNFSYDFFAFKYLMIKINFMKRITFWGVGEHILYSLALKEKQKIWQKI